MRSGVIASTRRFFVDLYVIFKNRVLTDSGTFIENPIEFNNEKLLLTPNAYKENKIYSALPLDGSGDFTFSRNSSATYIEDGIIKTAQPNVPRIQDGKILIEPQRTNLIKDSEVFSSYGTVAIINESPMPSPIKSTSYLLNDGTDNNRHRLITPFQPMLGQTYTYTYILKKADSDWVQICLQYPHFPLEVWANFNLSTGEIGNEGEQGVGKIESLGNGWYKCSVTGVCINGESAAYPHIMSTNNINSGRYPRYIGTNMDCFYIACVQLEEGNKATSYIPTNGTVVTRLADIATVTPPNDINEIIETIDGVESGTLIIPSTYQLPIGNIDNVKMRDNLLLSLFKTRVLNDSGFWVDKFIPFNNEKLLLTPNAYKENKIYSALPSDGSGDFTFSRNSSATYIEDGIIKTALPNVPRIQDGKILIEGQSTNLATNSSSFQNTNNQSLTTTANIPNDYAPWNSTLRETLVNGAHTGLSNFNVFTSFSQLANKTKAAFSFILEKKVGDYLYFEFSLINVIFNFDFSVGAIIRSDNIVKNRITEVKTGVFLVDIVAEFTPTTSIYVQLRGGSTVSETSNISEVGSHGISYFAYHTDTDDFIGIIPTSGGSATRLADIAIVTPPQGVTEIIETIDGVEQPPITTIPPTYQLPIGEINKVIMK